MDDLIVLTDDYLKSPAARSVPQSYFEHEIKAWAVPKSELTSRGASVILALFPELAFDYPEIEAARDQEIQDVRPFDHASEFNRPIGAPQVQDRLWDDEKALYEFQALDLGYVNQVLREHGGAYIGWERGLGKTLGAIALIEELQAQRVLIVAPNTAKRTVWEPEVEELLPHECFVLPNVKRQRERVLRWVKDHSRLVLIVHYEALDIIANMRSNKRGWDQYGEWDLVIADEAHRIKNPKTKMSRAIKKVPAAYKLALSGTIIANHADELFSPLQWLFPKRYKSKWRDWNDRYLDYVDGGFAKVFVGIKSEKLDEMREELGVFMVYRRKEDELDLPERTDQTLTVELTPGQRKVYDELVATCMTQLESGEKLYATEGLVMLTKLRQIATGLDLVGDEMTDSSKLDVAVEMIEDNQDEAFVVFSWYKAAATALADRLSDRGILAWAITGDVRQEERAEVIEAFQGGEGQVLIGTISTMGESVNLFRANNAIFLDRSWNPGDNVQAEDRIYRIGQDKPVTITHLVAKDTVDEHRVLPAIKNKEALRKLILGANT